MQFPIHPYLGQVVSRVEAIIISPCGTQAIEVMRVYYQYVFIHEHFGWVDMRHRYLQYRITLSKLQVLHVGNIEVNLNVLQYVLAGEHFSQ